MESFGDLSNIWIITPEDRKRHDLQFYQLNPVAGYLTGEQVKYFFLQSNLPTPILGQIWQLSDLTADGRFDQKEFSIAMHLIRRFYEGVTLPSFLPSTLLIEPHVGASSGHNVLGFPMIQAPSVHPSSYSTMPRPSNAVTSNNMKTLSPQSKPYAVSTTLSNEWGIPQNLRLRYKQTFNSHDHSHKGYITGLEAKNILVQSGLTHTILAQIWSLADVDTDGNLSPDEFCIAMYLIEEAKMGHTIPKSLPLELMPPSSRRFRRMSETLTTSNNATMPLNHKAANRKDTFDDLLSNFPLQNNLNSTSIKGEESPPSDSEAAKIVTFEDKRKENFDKGQAELEKRRQMLIDMQQQESRDRLAAEKAELDRQEKIRLEQEAKKQQEMDKQLEKQMRIEMEKEEQRRKAIEQREAARRDLERQRQLEWERQHQDQLNVEKLREHSLVEQLRHQAGQLKLQLDSHEAKYNEIMEKLVQARKTMGEFEASINSMRLSRDSKMATIEKLQAENEEFELTRVAAQQEFIRLSRQVNTPNSIAEKDKEVILNSHSAKKLAVEKLKKKIEEDNSELFYFNHQIQDASVHLKSLNDSLEVLKSSCSSLDSELNSKRLNYDQTKKKKVPTATLR